MAKAKKDEYGLSKVSPSRPISAPRLDYRPRDPKHYRPAIGLIGCGGISGSHLTAYKRAGYRVAALCDLVEEKARERQKEFYPRATVYTDYRDLLQRDDIEVVDIATHPPERVAIIEDALEAGKHVLSQKPFVLDLDVGQRLVDLAAKKGVRLAVNQNGRWAPHFSYIRHALQDGLLGDTISANLTVHWDHTWIIGTVFEEIHHLVLYDFGIHWFDAVSQFFGDRAVHSVYASVARAKGQQARPPMLAQCLIEYDGGQASLIFNAQVPLGQEDRTYVAGTRGTILSIGPSLSDQTLTIYLERGFGSPKLQGQWFPDGFHGTMGELLCAIEEEREPENSARNNLKSLELCFAAIASATDGKPKQPGRVRKLPKGAVPHATKPTLHRKPVS